MSRAIDAITVANSISETIAKVCKPMTDDQRTVLVGALAVWLDKAHHAARAEALREAAEKCDSVASGEGDEDYALGAAYCAEAIRAMADREGK